MSSLLTRSAETGHNYLLESDDGQLLFTNQGMLLTLVGLSFERQHTSYETGTYAYAREVDEAVGILLSVSNSRDMGLDFSDSFTQIRIYPQAVYASSTRE